MGNYVFDTEVLIEAVTPSATGGKRTDIGGDVIPYLTEQGVARLYDFSRNVISGQTEHERGTGVMWGHSTRTTTRTSTCSSRCRRSVSTTANGRCTATSCRFPLPSWRPGPPVRRPHVSNSLLCAGTIVSGGRVDTSILSPLVFVDDDAEVTESILFPVSVSAPEPACIVV